MKINYNISAMIANTQLQKNDNNLSVSIEKLSSGYKINHAKDNASGLAMAKRMHAQIRSLETAKQNSNDGISVLEIAEGALQEIEDMVQRMNELAVKASTGTVTDDDRKAIDTEIRQLKSEITRVSETTMYNGQVLLDGTFDMKGYTSEYNLKVSTYTDNVKAGDYVIDSISATLVDSRIDPSSFSISLGANFPTGATYEIKGDRVVVTGPNDFNMEFQVKDSFSASDIEVKATGLGSMGLQIGTNAGQELGTRLSTISLSAMGLEGYDCLTEENAQEFLGQISGAIKYVNQARSRLGAYENRLEHTVSTLGVSEENMTAAYSRIMDVDMASEMTEYSKNQILTQAGTSVLAQANERPSEVLQLLQ